MPYRLSHTTGPASRNSSWMRCGSSKNSTENGSTSEVGASVATLMALPLLSGSPERHADVVLGERRGRRDRAGHQVELRELAAVVEFARLLEAVEHGGHPPGEVLRPPHPPQ